MDSRMLAIMANHATILQNQEHVIRALSHQHDCLEHLKEEVTQARQVIEDVRNLLATFKIMGALTKWSAVVGAAMFSLWHGVKAAFQFWK